MKVQFLLSWCLERGVSELSPLSRSIHLEHGKYILKSLISLLYYINFVLVSHMYVSDNVITYYIYTIM